MHLKIVVEGKPMGQPRPRFDPRTSRTYTPEKAGTYKSYVKVLVTEAKRKQNWQIINEGPVQILIEAFYPIATSWSKKKKAQALAGVIYPTVKPDFDNVEKCVLDAMSGIVYGDDKQVCDCTTRKRYSTEPRVEILVMPIAEGFIV